ncbi:MAG: HAD family phosphatase [Anaerolineales bacterium]|jgi:HAD superfamily hydrolase (TIGR01509 family)|nr:HAD family phosphatase [Anaerolineales bacterium]
MTNLLQPFAVLWDLDGTLVDSAEMHYQSWIGAFSEHSIPFDRDLFTRTFGMNNHSIITTLLGNPPTELLEQISERKEILYRQMIPTQLRLFPGVLDWLNRFKDRAIPMAVASSAPRQNIADSLQALQIGAYFQAIVSVFGRPGKPDPLVFLEAAQALHIPPERCIVVEDAIAGVEAARRAGMKCLAVLNTNSPEALNQADQVVERLDLLPPHAFDRLFASN